MNPILPILASALPSAAFDLDRLDGATIVALASDGPLIATSVDVTGRMKEATAATFIRASPEKVQSVIADFGSYPTWMPQVRSAQVLNSTGDTITVAYELVFDFFLTFKVAYTLEYTRTGSFGMTFHQIKGDFAQNYGGWEIRPYGNGSILYYKAYVDYRSMRILRPILSRQPSIDFGLGTSTVAVFVQASRKEVERR